MSNTVSLIFPHQLFKDNPVVQVGRKVYLIEEALFFKQYHFHQQKIVLHRASMRFYEDYLKSIGVEVNYIEHHEKEADCSKLIEALGKKGISSIYITEVADNWLMKKITNAGKKNGIKIHVSETPYFLNSMNNVEDFFSKRKTYFQTDFYTWQRKERKILLEKDGKPAGGKWTYDAENRM